MSRIRQPSVHQGIRQQQMAELVINMRLRYGKNRQHGGARP